MAATKKQMSWSSVGFTPSGGSLAAWDSIDGVDIDDQVSILAYKGDASVYPTLKVLTAADPVVNVATSDPALSLGLAGTYGTWTGTHNDAKGASGGAIVYTLSNAIVGSTRKRGPHAQWGTASMPIEAYSSDGVTSPLGYTRT